MAKAPRWGKRLVVQYSLNLIHEFASLFSPKCFSVVAQATAKIGPRPAQGLFQMKELHRTTKAIAQMNADWKVEKAQYAEFNVPTCEHPLKPPMFDSLYRRVMRCQNPVKRWEISKAIPDTILFYLSLNSDCRQESQEFQAKNSRAIPHDHQNPESSTSEGRER